MNAKKLTIFLLVLSSAFLNVASGKCCSAQKTTTVRRTCRPACQPTCRPAAKKPSCGTRTKTVIKCKGKPKGRMMPLAPGRYHYHFEHIEFSNSIERISFPYPVRTRYRGS